MFMDRTGQIAHNPLQLHYGIAVTDIDDDGDFEFFVTGYGGCPNKALKWDGGSLIDIATPELADIDRQAIGVAAADIDDDGREELYILNADTFMGRKRMADRLFDHADGAWVDLFTLRVNIPALNLTSGRSVACVDRFGNGRYGFFVANYGGPLRLYELDDDGRIEDVAAAAGIAYVTGGRGVVVLPLVSERMDIFAGNENGPNFLFRNNGDGTFEEIAVEMGVGDPFENVRGIAPLDGNRDGRFDLVYGNWEGAHRLFVQTPDGRFYDRAPREMASPSRVRTVIAADFDNDGYEEIFFNNIGQPNRVFGWRNGTWMRLTVGAALEPAGLGTGAAVADIDNDGRLELLIAHGEASMQPLTFYSAAPNANHWLRIRPLTPAGAPARGAVVTLEAGDRVQRRAIDAGSGYLCQMEPIAHFGLGTLTAVERVTVRFTDGVIVEIAPRAVDTTLIVEHPHAAQRRTYP